jgi:hypothetical protein
MNKAVYYSQGASAIFSSALLLSRTTKPMVRSISSAQASAAAYADLEQLHAFWQRGTCLLQVLQANASGTKQQCLMLSTVCFNACVCLSLLQCFFLGTCNLMYLLIALSLTGRKESWMLSVAPCFPMYVSYSYEIMILAQVWRSLIQKSHSQQYSPEGLPEAPCS